eukprot:g44184.t1
MFNTVVQMFQGRVEGQEDGICCGPVGLVCKLQGIKAIWEAGVDVTDDQPVEALANYGCQSHWAVVIKTGDEAAGIFGGYVTTVKDVQISGGTGGLLV